MSKMISVLNIFPIPVTRANMFVPAYDRDVTKPNEEFHHRRFWDAMLATTRPFLCSTVMTGIQLSLMWVDSVVWGLM